MKWIGAWNGYDDLLLNIRRLWVNSNGGGGMLES